MLVSVLMSEKGQEQGRSHTAKPQGQWMCPSLLFTTVGVTRVSFECLLSPFYTAAQVGKGRSVDSLILQKSSSPDPGVY